MIESLHNAAENILILFVMYGLHRTLVLRAHLPWLRDRIGGTYVKIFQERLVVEAINHLYGEISQYHSVQHMDSSERTAARSLDFENIWRRIVRKEV